MDYGWLFISCEPFPTVCIVNTADVVGRYVGVQHWTATPRWKRSVTSRCTSSTHCVLNTIPCDFHRTREGAPNHRTRLPSGEAFHRLDLSPTRHHTRLQRQSLDQQKWDLSENTTLLPSIVRAALVRHHCNRSHLCHDVYSTVFLMDAMSAGSDIHKDGG
ncbi:hypothetical protein TNCV_2840761 [Trichonephila clavipes]|uniref:Uncharacterized protein n=1 Tax=Trichonephila clavipes TaxID=2585209 RepID=A0A8X6UYD8_TRICX|nr:hypothetical protein TNCV_2840761 [Trichonephila clavipes]